MAGSVAPLPRPRPAGYRERLDFACKARRDMGRWYEAPADKAYAAAADPRAIVQVARCGEKTKLPCLSVGLAQGTGRGSDTDPWTLDVQYRDKGGLKIVRVDVGDAHIDF